MRRIAIAAALALTFCAAAAPTVLAEDSVSQGYYAGYTPLGYYPKYVMAPNYPACYPHCLGYGIGVKGYLLYRPRYIFGHPAGTIPGCPLNQKTGPVYYSSGRPLHAPLYYEELVKPGMADLTGSGS